MSCNFFTQFNNFLPGAARTAFTYSARFPADDVSTALTTTVMPIKLTSPVLKAKSDMRNVNRPVTTSPPLISFGFLSFAVDFSYSFLYNFSIYLAIV